MNNLKPYRTSLVYPMRITAVLLALFITSCITPSFAQGTINVGGTNWTVPISPITEAGANYAASYESVANQILISATLPILLSNARISVQYQANPTWHGSLNIAARRTGSGQTLCVLCAVTGGTTYLPITTVATELFRIQNVLALTTFNNIPVQLRLSGVSVTTPAASYGARVIFTIGPL